MKWIDTHTHLYLENFDTDRDIIIHEAQNLGFSALLLPNIDVDSIGKIKSLVETHPRICYPMVGLHPCDVNSDYEKQLRLLKDFLDKGNNYFNNKIVAVGEIGLDYYWDKTFISEQKKAFRIQIEWALEAQLPIVVHTRDAMDDAIAIVRDYAKDGLQGVFHCYSGDIQQAIQIIDMGLYLGIGGVLTYKKSMLPAVVSELPLSVMVLETDAPFLPPVPYRGKRNEPKYMIEVAKRLSEIKNVSLEAVAAITTSNAALVFHLP